VAVSTDQDNLVRILEDHDFEAIPLTADSVIDNIRSLETSNVVIVDGYSPSWVMREVEEHHKLTIGYRTVAPGDPVTALVTSDEQLVDLLTMLKPFCKTLTPLSPEYVRRLASVMAMFPVRRCATQ
jgi:hypothetical protein